MKHILFTEQTEDSYKVAILVKDTNFTKNNILTHYVSPISSSVPVNDVIGFNLKFDSLGKVKAIDGKAHLANVLPALDSLGVDTILCANGNYFKFLTGVQKISGSLGYVVPCKIKDYEHMNIILTMDSASLMHDPSNQDKIDIANNTLVAHYGGSKAVLGEGKLHYACYPENDSEVAREIEKLHAYPELTIDIEALSLKFHEAGIETIAFSWSQHEGVAFPIDKDMLLPSSKLRRELLKEFLSSYKGKLIGANLGYDFKVLVYELWMDNFYDREGMLKGIDILCRDFDDTKVIAYLATNSTTGNNLGLKDLSHEFMGNYGLDVKDTSKIPLEELLEYNLKDTCSTFYVRDKYYPLMVQDQQEEVYRGMFKEGVKLLIHTELTGLPLNMPRVIEVKNILQSKNDNAYKKIMGSDVIVTFSVSLRLFEMEKANAKLKKLVKTVDQFEHVVFNPNSNQQLQMLLYEHLELPVLDRTDTKQPATGKKTLEKLLNHTDDPKEKEFIQALLDYMGVVKILTSFIPAFEKAPVMPDGSHRLFGNFNICGTVSGRLSSNGPNLQNLPSGSEYGKLIKSCFEPSKGRLFSYADFSSLEDRINALLTKDSNKLKVYIDGFDGHSLRAFSYFPEKLPGINSSVESINSIADKFPEVRSESKAPTFLLTYAGSYHGLMKNVGMTEEQALQVESNYHKLYEESDNWMTEQLNQAGIDGYVTLAFGLRLRTPILKKTIAGNKVTPNIAKAEARTAGNAVGGQSYGQINTRAAIEFMERVFASKFKHDIWLCALIHDAIYLESSNTLEVVGFINKNLIECMEWNELPEIQHDIVKLGAELDVCYGSWDKPITLPNKVSNKDIIHLANEGAKKYNKK